MGFYEDAKQEFLNIYNKCQKNNLTTFSLSLDSYRSMSKENQEKFMRNMEIMLSEGWIQKYNCAIGAPFQYQLVTAGIKMAEGVFSSPATTTDVTYNINTVNGIVGNNASGNTFHNGLSIENIEQLLMQNNVSISDSQEILSVLKEMLSLMENNQSLPKGLLSKINTKLESCSWLASPVAQKLLDYFSS